MVVLMKDSDVVVNQKKALRSDMKKNLKDFFARPDAVKTASAAASRIFLDSPLYKNAETVFAFVSCGLEIDTSIILHRALEDKKRLAVPRVISDTEMDFFYLQDDVPLKNQLVSGAFTILEPAEFLERLEPLKVNSSASLMIVPGLAFTKDGVRLGKGKGFYDRYFKRFLPSASCGFCFDFQIVGSIPHTELDVKVSHLVSESNFIECR